MGRSWAAAMSPSGHLSLFIPMENLGDDLQLTNRNVDFTAEGFAARTTSWVLSRWPVQAGVCC